MAPRSTGKIAVSLVDAHGTVVSVDRQQHGHPVRAARVGARDVRGAHAARPLHGHGRDAVTKPRPLPDMLRLDGASGTADLTVSVEGTALDPRVTMHGGMHSLRLARGRKSAPIEARADRQIRRRRSQMPPCTSRAPTSDGHEGRPARCGRAREREDQADIVERGAAAWDGVRNAKLKDFPLAMVPPLADRRVHGTANGEIELTGLHRDARAKLDLDVTDLRVGKAEVRQDPALLRLRRARPRRGPALRSGAGAADAQAKMALRWGAQLVPSPDPSGSTHASLTAKKLRMGFVAPFLQSAADALDGSLDADAHVNLDPGKKPEMSGTISLSDGVVGPGRRSGRSCTP